MTSKSFSNTVAMLLAASAFAGCGVQGPPVKPSPKVKGEQQVAVSRYLDHEAGGSVGGDLGGAGNDQMSSAVSGAAGRTPQNGEPSDLP